jgi:hypothetical protein
MTEENTLAIAEFKKLKMLFAWLESRLCKFYLCRCSSVLRVWKYTEEPIPA